MTDSRRPQLKCFQTLPSTQDYCLQQCRLGEGAGLNVLAYHQSAQRASRGRQWVGADGSLALSMVLRREERAFNPAIWAFIGGLGFFDGLVRATPLAGKYLSIKWPNDILLKGKKLGGVLIEVDGTDIVIGMGANIARLPGGGTLKRQVACLAQVCDILPPLRDIAFSIVEEVYFWHGQCLKKGFGILREAWLERSVPVGTKMEIRSGNIIKKGFYQGISKQGHLELKTQQGREVFVSADILQMQKETVKDA